jgi:hypothetical protein
MTGLKTQVSSQSRQPEHLAEPFETEAQVAASELESVLQRGGASNSKAKPLSQTRPKRSSAAGMVFSLGIMLGCVALIVNWFVQHFANPMPAPSLQPNLMQGLQTNFMQSPQANLMQSPQGNLMGSPLLPRQPGSFHFQAPMSNLPPAGFSTHRLLAARGYHQATIHHKTKPASHAAKVPAQKPVQYVVPTKMY